MTRWPALVIFAYLPLFAQTYDLVLANGPVMDPDTNFDAVRNVGVQAGRIAVISTSELRGNTVINANGLLVAPGFIDLHSHGQTPENYAYKARDGVTTALELEIGVGQLQIGMPSVTDKALINFGASTGHVPAIKTVLHDMSRSLASLKQASFELLQLQNTSW